jgi:hypothetical protein
VLPCGPRTARASGKALKIRHLAKPTLPKQSDVLALFGRSCLV